MLHRLGFTWLRRGMFRLVTVLTSMLLAHAALAQIGNDYQIGMPNHGEFSGTDFEQVQLNNNNLHIDLPLWATTGRGPSVGFRFVYDSKGWGFNETCNHISGLCTDRVLPNPGWQRGSLPNHLKLILVGPQSYGVARTSGSFTCNGTNVTVLTYDYAMSLPDGTTHHFAPGPVEFAGESAYCFPNPTTLYADDGSGWMLKIDQNGIVLKVVGKDGTVISGGTITDANGNQVFTSTSPGTDTLGRQFNSDGSYYDSNGVLRTISSTAQSVAIQTALCGFSNGDYCYEYSGTWNVAQTITLPNGLTYTFSYDQGSPTHPYYGQPLSVTLPTGGQISWGWGGVNESGPVLLSRQLSSDPQPWNYAFNYATSTGTVTDPAGNDMTYTCGWYSPPYNFNPGTLPDPPCYIITKKYYQGSSTSNNLIKTVQTDYWTTNEPAILPIHETTTWNPQNLVSRVEMDYDSWAASTFRTTTIYATGGNIIEKREYAFGTGSWGAQVRTTDFGYLHLSNSTYFGLNILNKVTSQKVYSGSSQTGTLTAQTLNTYDGVTIAVNTSANPAPNHDYTGFPASYNFRGNLTQMSRGLKTGSTWTWLNTAHTYNDLGEVLTTTDPRGYTITSDYTDNWASISNPQCVTSTHSYAFPTTITDPLGHRTKHTYYSCTSLTGSTQDENDITASRAGTTFTYDLMDRTTAVNLPDGGQTTFSYNDAVPYSQTSTQLIKTGLSKVSTVVHDGLGRMQQTQLVDPDCPSGPVKVDYTYGYGSQGRQTQVSTPYCGSPGGTYGLMTTTNFDALDRLVTVQQTDTSTTTTTYAGNCQTVTDEAGKTRQSCFDALGRLTQVWEDPGSSPHLNYETDYSYDILNDVTSVTQRGGATSAYWRTRSFTYDSLSRLTCAANPEITPGLSTVNPASCPATYSGTYTNGTSGYSYDADGNLATRTAPAPNQTSTSSTVVTTYAYDHVNRLTQKSYTGTPSTPTVQYGYDGVALTGCTTTPPSVTDSNPVNPRTSMCDGSGATSWTHD
jgi:YD repeat-containing protein